MADNHTRISSPLAAFDDLQAQFAPWVVAPMSFAADAFCTFDHFAPWSTVIMAATFGLMVLSIGLHGAWRLRLKRQPFAATAALLAAAAVFVWEPELGVTRVLGLVLFIVPMGLGLGLWIRLLGSTSVELESAVSR